MEDSFAFSQRQPAGGQRNAGLRQPPGLGQIFRLGYSVRGQDFGDPLFVGWINVVENNVTIGCQPDWQSQLLGNGPEGGPPLALLGILDPALFNPEGKEELPVSLFPPAEYVAHGVPADCSWPVRREHPAV